MADKSSIEWTDATWNPIVGCSIVSPGCTHCYAMKRARRIEAMTWAMQSKGWTGTPHYDGTTRSVNGNAVWTGKLALAPERILFEPLTWRRPRRIFVNSMGDLFHENVPDEAIDRVFAVMALAPQHTFQVLTKRAERMRLYLAKRFGEPSENAHDVRYAAQWRVWMLLPKFDPLKSGCPIPAWPLPNVWLGVSTERQQEADQRIPELLATPAAIRFVSAEPLLGPIDFEAMPFADGDTRHKWSALTGQALMYATSDCGGPDFTVRIRPPIKAKLDWIIVGGESGPSARAMHPAWARQVRDQCRDAGVTFFFKQWGEWAPSTPEAAHGNPSSGWRCLAAHPHVAKADELYPEVGAAFVAKVGKKAAGRLLDGVEHNGMPELREVRAL